MDINEFDNLLDKIYLTSNDIEETVRNYKLSFMQCRNHDVEHKIQFPMFLNCFYENILINQKVLDQNDFANAYVKLNLEWIKKQNFSNDIISGLKARIFRTYPSLVRDLHFSLMLKESCQYQNVIYDIKLDTVYGIDILIKQQEKLFGVNLYTNTKNANEFRNNKLKRHLRFEDVNYIELPVSFNGSNKCGDFYLYGIREFNLLMKIIDYRLTPQNA